MSGHCANPQTSDPAASHARCAERGGGSRANPEKRFHPCGCPCHLAHVDPDTARGDRPNIDGTYGDVEHYTCGCGGIIAEAPVFGMDEDGDPVYVHVDKKTGRMLYRECRS